MAVKLFLSSQLCLLFLLTHITDADSCPNQTLTVWTGSFQPSSYPSDYAPNLDCYWLIQVSAGNLIEINFQDFVMDGDTVDNCINDYVEFLEGSYGSTDSIKRLCGANLPFGNEYRRVRSKGSSLLVHMHTDAANEDRGFQAGHQGICDVTFSTVSGAIMSPNHPDKYLNSMACEWIIDLGPGYDITITFHKFNLEMSDDCSFDWLTVQAGNTPDSPEVAKVCGDVLPPDMTTRGPMRIVFQTDTDNEFEGFHVTWLAHESLVQNATETVQLVAGNITVSTMQPPNPVTATTVDIWSAKTREFVQSVPAVSITGSSTPAPDSLTSAIVNKRSATATVDVLFQSVAASKTEPWVSFVVLITTIACLNLLSFK